MNIKIDKCAACPLFRTDENFNSGCKLDSTILFEREIRIEDTQVHDNCPLKDSDIKLEYTGEKNVTRATAFLFHAKEPNFGMEDILFTPGNFEIVAEIYKKDVTPDWIFEHTQNLDESWTETKWTKKEKITSHFSNIRSTSAGDIIVIADRFAPGEHLVLRCDNIGWKPVDVLEYCCTGCHEALFGDNWPSLKKHFFFSGCNCE
jgi:hypothetical protein